MWNVKHTFGKEWHDNRKQLYLKGYGKNIEFTTELKNWNNNYYVPDGLLCDLFALYFNSS